MGLLQRFRSAITGRYVSADEATSSPSTTVSVSDSAVREAARALVEAYYADDTDRASSYADRFERLRVALAMPIPAMPGSEGGRHASR